MYFRFTTFFRYVVYPATLIGFASSIVVILEQGVILDSIVPGLSLVLNYVPRIFSGGAMMIMQSVINFFIPSGTGQAMVTMPLMAGISIAHISYTRWFKFASKIILMELVLGFVFLMISVQINLSPF